MKPLQVCTIIAVVFISLGSLAHADEAKPKKLPKSGLLASTSISGAGNTIVTDTFGGEDLTGTDIAPITGSVSRLNEKTWSLKVFNNSDDTYSFSVDLIQKNDAGSVLSNSSYSFQLRARSSDSRQVQSVLNASGADLVLRTYRNLSAERAARENP